MRYYLYVHTNRINGKKYIGITVQDPKKRWANGKGYSNQKKFYSAIIKYGWDNFEHQFWELSSEKDMLYGEKYLIAFYNSVKEGYNTTPGGKSCWRTGYRDPNVTIHKMDYRTEEEYRRAYNKWYNRPKEIIFSTKIIYD